MDLHHNQLHHNQQRQYVQQHQLQQQQQVNHQHHHQQVVHSQNKNQNQNRNQLGGSGTSVSVDVTDRFPQWSLQETKELLAIRSNLDQTFMETKRNKPLWEVIAARMKEKGFHRSADQCKCKWKNLVTRYKGCETIEAESVRQQFPFYNELQGIFTARMQRMLWAEETSSKKKDFSSEEEEEEDEEVSEGGGAQRGGHVMGTKSKKAMKRSRSGTGMRDLLEEFMRQQAESEARWMEAWEAREEERRAREEEWRRAMAAIDAERVTMERTWREREEQRRARDEARADKRDALITNFLHKLTRDHDV